jgi:hypothetical protein
MSGVGQNTPTQEGDRPEEEWSEPVRGRERGADSGACQGGDGRDRREHAGALLALAAGAGLQVMATMMEADVTGLAGPKGIHDRTRAAVRVAVTRPRVRAVDGSGGSADRSYELFSSTELGRMAMETSPGRAVDPPISGQAGARRAAG